MVKIWNHQRNGAGVGGTGLEEYVKISPRITDVQKSGVILCPTLEASQRYLLSEITFPSPGNSSIVEQRNLLQQLLK